MLPRITVISTARNAERFARRCVESVACQDYPNVVHRYLDAGSTDATRHVLDGARLAANGRLEVHLQDEPKSILDNVRMLTEDLHPRAIVSWLDGDDRLIPDTALSTIYALHARGALVTYGSFLWHDGTPGFAGPVGATPRTESWRATHLKTFRAGLFRAIPDEYLHDGRGESWQYAGDQAVMLAMLDLARPRAYFVPEILYFYNSQGYFAQTEEQRQAAAREVRAIREQRPLCAWSSAELEELAPL